jgi:hypothetical protein
MGRAGWIGVCRAGSIGVRRAGSIGVCRNVTGTVWENALY